MGQAIQGGQTRFERLELKYLIDEQTARAIRSDILPYCVPDPYNSPAYGGGYPIYSLYLDTPTLGFHRSKMRSEPDRLKLRIRTYSPETPAHFEVKRKCRDVVEKTRATVDRNNCADAMRGFGQPLNDTPQQRQFLSKFAYLVAQTGALPTLLVKYDREAYVSRFDRYARVTFDRRIAAQRVEGLDLVGNPSAWCSLAGRWLRDGHHSPVLLELKCETMMPAWMSAIIQRHSLGYQGFSKYCEGIEVTDRWYRGVDASPAQRGAYI